MVSLFGQSVQQLKNFKKKKKDEPDTKKRGSPLSYSNPKDCFCWWIVCDDSMEMLIKNYKNKKFTENVETSWTPSTDSVSKKVPCKLSKKKAGSSRKSQYSPKKVCYQLIKAASSIEL